MKTARKYSVETKGTHAVNVLLAYDNPRACSAILGMFDRISGRLHDEKLFKINAFKFSLLERMDPLQCDAVGAGTPELAVVAFGEPGAPGAALLGWLEHWAERHAGKEAALGLLPMGPATSEPVQRFVRTTKDIAARHGLGFIYDSEAPCQELC
jgi:hypothetical protein